MDVRRQQQGIQRTSAPPARRYVDALSERTNQVQLQSATLLGPFLALDVPARYSDVNKEPSCSLLLHVPTEDTAANTAKLLSALAVALRHSQLLSSSPKKKASFWKAVLSSEATTSMRCTTAERAWMLEDELFPSRVMLKVANRTGPLSEALLKQICAFFTAKPDWRFRELLKLFPFETEHVRRRKKVSVGLVLMDVKLEARAVKVLQRVVLDQVGRSARGDRWFCLEMLDLSKNNLDAEALHAVADILKSNDVYKLTHVDLSNVTRRGEILSSDASSALTAIIQAIFGFRSRIGAHSSTRHRRADRSLLSTMLLDENYLRVEHYAALFSALRYDETLRELGLAGTMSSGMDVDERAQCWRWIAFGLFCPRFSEFPCTRIDFPKIDLSMSSFTTADTDAFEQTLHNPAELLNYRGRSSLISRGSRSESFVPDDTPARCEIKEGAVIRGDPDLASEPLFTVKDATQLECLWIDGDWSCVVLPGIGLGWAETDQVRQVDERETSASVDELLPQAAVVMNSISWPNSVPLCSFIRTAGTQLVALELQHNSCMENVIPTILGFCTNLQQLNVEGWITSFSDSSAYEPDVLELFQALHVDFGRQLLSLDLTGNRVGDSMIAILATSLSAPHQIPALQHLRLCRSWMGEQGLRILRGALEVNKTLSCLELDVPVGLAESPPRSPRPMQLEAVRLDENFDGELLWCEPLPLEAKLAFLSVLAPTWASVDTWVVSLVFEFASRGVRRRIVWR